MNIFKMIDGTIMIYTPIYAPIFISIKNKGKYFNNMKKKGYRTFVVNSIKSYYRLIKEIKYEYSQKEELGYLNMLSAFAKITEDDELKRIKIQQNTKFFV